MAYTRLGLKDGDKVNASHVDHIEDELVSLDDNKADQTAVDQNAKDIATNADAISEINQSLTDLSGAFLFKGVITKDEIDGLTKPEDIGIYRFSNQAIPGTANRWGFLINLPLETSSASETSTWWGCQICITTNYSQILSLRYYSSSAWTSWYVANVTAV